MRAWGKKGKAIPIVVGNPKACDTLLLHQVDAMRWTDCRHYNQCLNFAEAQDWSGFCCLACDAYRPLPVEVLRDQAKVIGRVFSSVTCATDDL